MDRQHSFYAFLATMVTTLIIVGIASLLAYNGKYAEALGVGAVLSGLMQIATLLARPNSTPAGNTQADANLATALDKLPPQTPGLTTPPASERNA